MADIRIQRVDRARNQFQELTAEMIQRRLDLHTTHSFERIRSIKTDSGTLALPTMDEEQSQALRELYTQASPDLRERLVRDSHHLVQHLGALGAKGLEMEEVSDELRSAVGQAMETYVVTTGEQQTETIINGTMLMALDGAQQDVLELANQLATATQNGRTFREDLADFRNTLADWPEDLQAMEFTWHEMTDTGSIIEKTEMLTKEKAHAKMEELEMTLGTIGDMRQEWQLSLQDALNRQQQAFQILSNIIKMMHDTAKSVIQNVRG